MAGRLIGRRGEVATLLNLLDGATRGRGTIVIVEGEAGAGKTRLVREILATAATQGIRILIGRCDDYTQTLPYGPWLDLADEPALRERYPALLAPRDVAADGAAPLQRPAYFARWRDALLAEASRAPVALLLEDCHWADGDSLDLLRYLARPLAAAPLLLIATVRTGGAAMPFAFTELAVALDAVGLARYLRLPPLGDADIAELIASRYALPTAARDRLATVLATATNGNPFYLGEVLRALEEERLLRRTGGGWALGDLAAFRAPARLAQLVLARVRHLGSANAEALARAAVLGREVPLALWSALEGGNEDALHAVIAGAIAAGLLEASADGAAVRFAHALVRDALYEDLPTTERRRWHRRVAEALLVTPTPDPGLIAEHLQLAGDQRAASWLIAAGARDERAAAWGDAAGHFAAALALLERDGAAAEARGWLALRLALLRRYEDDAGAFALVGRARDEATRLPDPALAAYSRFHGGLLRCFAGDYRRGLADLAAGAEALDALSAADFARARGHGIDTGEAVGAHRGTLAFYLAAVGRHAEATALAGALLARLGPDAPVGADAHYALGLVHAVQGRVDEARSAYARARRHYRAVGNPYLVAVATTEELLYVALPYAAEDLAARAALAVEAEVALAEAAGLRAAVTPALAHLPQLAVGGRWAEALALGDALRAAGGDAESFAPEGLIARLAALRGEVTRAHALVAKVLPEGPLTAPGGAIYTTALGLQRLAATLTAESGDAATAADWLAAHERWLAWGNATLGRADGALLAAELALLAGDVPLARRHAARARDLAAAPRQAFPLLATERVLALASFASGDLPTALAHCAAALALADACAAPFERARTLLVRARLDLAAGERAAAERALAEARAIYAALGAAADRATIAALEAALTNEDSSETTVAPAMVGTVSAAAPATRPPSLTRRETEVLRLVARGYTNEAIATTLHISPKTAINHVTHILHKTGTENRTAAAAYAVRHGLA